MRGFTVAAALLVGMALLGGTALGTAEWGAEPAYASGSPLSLGSAADFSVLGASTVTNTGVTTLAGKLGVSPGTAVSGFPTGTAVSPSVAAQAHVDASLAYEEGVALPSGGSVSGDLVGQTLTPRVYTAASSLALSGTLTLDAQSDPNARFVFQIGSTLTTASNSRIELVNGARAANVYWLIGSSATLGTNSALAGTVLAFASITVTTGVSIEGRAIAVNGAVTLDSNTFSAPMEYWGSLTAVTAGAGLAGVTLNGTNTQFSTGTSTQWSVTDSRADAAPWTVSVSATTPTSAAGTVDTAPRTLPVGNLTITPGGITTGGGQPSGISAAPLALSAASQPLISAPAASTGTFVFTPTFSLAVPANAYRSNFAGTIADSSLNPFVTVLTITIA
ncbi:ice-binding family protein [Cryobacterium roopkundense]|uniref:DUF3494 domain-containing protein n=1 Tax=Cryobacterium roopkundense TaxID=1001240 RepID=A0A7W8ZU07_9MICO|nr:ice-binding family protein [Cryobacterium roopkundense]MBB5640050.1 hypothetical protein [Cryobacterium roopkundense]